MSDRKKQKQALKKVHAHFWEALGEYVTKEPIDIKHLAMAFGFILKDLCNSGEFDEETNKHRIETCLEIIEYTLLECKN
jgi:hypothetical protein